MSVIESQEQTKTGDTNGLMPGVKATAPDEWMREALKDLRAKPLPPQARALAEMEVVRTATNMRQEAKNQQQAMHQAWQQGHRQGVLEAKELAWQHQAETIRNLLRLQVLNEEQIAAAHGVTVETIAQVRAQMAS